MSVGFGPAIGYRASFRGRVEGALGTMGFASGGSIGAGYSARVIDGFFHVVDNAFAVTVPLPVAQMNFGMTL